MLGYPRTAQQHTINHNERPPKWTSHEQQNRLGVRRIHRRTIRVAHRSHHHRKPGQNHMTAEYQVVVRRLDMQDTDNGPMPTVTNLADIHVKGESALARVLHGYAESIEDELPPLQYESDPPIIVKADWFEKALANASRAQEVTQRAHDVIRTHSSPNAKLAALYILNGDESTKQELYDIEPDIAYAPFDPEPQSH